MFIFTILYAELEMVTITMNIILVLCNADGTQHADGHHYDEYYIGIV